MKFVADFESFLRDEVNLNKTRLGTLTERVDTMEGFLDGDETFGPILLDLVPAGSWAYRTIIRPVADGDGFDADVLVHVKDQDGWLPCDYIENLYDAFRANSLYKDRVNRKTRCLRVNYAGEFHIDLVPYLERGGQHYITNRTDPAGEGKLERSDPEQFAEWLDERQRYTKGTFVKVVRLLKYLRDFKGTFACKSIILTTLLGDQVNAVEAQLRPEEYADVPTTLKTLLTKLADTLPEEMPPIMDPGGSGDDFAQRYGDSWNYTNFRDWIDYYADKVSEAYDAADRETSIKAWQTIFGPSFKPGALIKVAASAPTSAAVTWVGEQFIDGSGFDFAYALDRRFRVRMTGRCEMALAGGRLRRRGFEQFDLPRRGNQVPKSRQVRFTIRSINVPTPYRIYWKVRNGGDEARRANQLRGEITLDEGRSEKTETTSYTGTHYVECYVVKDGVVVATDHQAVIVQ